MLDFSFKELDELNKKIVDDKILALAIENLSAEHIASEAWCKPLLLLMEYNHTDNAKLSFIELSKNLHLEHVLPQKHKSYPDWNHITDEFSATWLNSAGNLTLLSGSKNIEASNNPFNTKIKIYRGKGKYDNKNDKITAFYITQKILIDFETEKYDKGWTVQSMIARWQWFFDEIGEIFSIDASSVRNKHIVDEEN